ncbi:MAG: hypothetical protein IPO58_11495 [Betaproteobacteria bacterium]|nr:hypothetical protein [Betaproteobacteria bacterium]
MFFVAGVISAAQTVSASAAVETNDVCVGDTSPETQRLFEQAVYPVYLMRGQDGTFTTFSLE